MTKQEYDKHISVTAEFLANLAHISQLNASSVIVDIREREIHEQLFKSLGKAYMALRRERIEKYGQEEEEVSDEH